MPFLQYTCCLQVYMRDWMPMAPIASSSPICLSAPFISWPPSISTSTSRPFLPSTCDPHLGCHRTLTSASYPPSNSCPPSRLYLLSCLPSTSYRLCTSCPPLLCLSFSFLPRLIVLVEVVRVEECRLVRGHASASRRRRQVPSRRALGSCHEDGSDLGSLHATAGRPHLGSLHAPLVDQTWFHSVPCK